ncbi:MAG: hypothetical protein ACK5XF_00110 [Neisseriaceae bacterium]
MENRITIKSQVSETERNDQKQSENNIATDKRPSEYFPTYQPKSKKQRIGHNFEVDTYFPVYKDIRFNTREKIELILLDNPEESIKWLRDKNSKLNQNINFKSLWNELGLVECENVRNQFLQMSKQILSFLSNEKGVCNRDYCRTKIREIAKLVKGSNEIKLLILILEQKSTPIDTFFFDNWIEISKRDDNMETAIELFHIMKEQNIPTNFNIYDNLIHGCIKSICHLPDSKSNLVSNFLRQMISANIKPNPAIFNVVIYKCLEEKKLEIALNFYKEFQKAGIPKDR